MTLVDFYNVTDSSFDVIGGNKDHYSISYEECEKLTVEGYTIWNISPCECQGGGIDVFIEK